MSNTRNTVHDFLNHRTQERSSGGFLDKWKEDGHLEHYLHQAHVPVCFWSHSIMSIVPKEDKQTRETVNHVWSRRYNCPESETTLKKQYFRNPDESRQHPPKVCGVCKLLDWTYLQIFNGKLALETPMFRYRGDVPAEATTIYAGGFVGLFKGDKLKPETKKRLIAAGISLAWEAVSNQSAMCQPQYLAVLVTQADPASGPKIATITGGLGDKIKDAIREEMDKAAKPAKMKGLSKGEIEAAASLRDPFTNPYMFEWFFHKTEPNPQKKYSVTAHVDVKPSEEVMAQLGGDPLDLSRILAPMNQAAVRARLENACVLSGKDAPPWDEFFPPAAEESDEDMTFPVEEDSSPTPEVGRSAEPSRAIAAPSAPPAKKTPEELVAGIPEDQLFGCEVCGKGSPTAEECVWCGARYDDQGNLIKAAPPPPEPPKQMRTRGPATKKFKAEF